MEGVFKFFGTLVGAAASVALVWWLALPTVVFFVALTFGYALQRFWLLAVVVMCCAIATALIVRAIQSSSTQVAVVMAVPILAIVITLAVVWQWGGFMACSLAATIAAVLYSAGAATCRVKGVHNISPLVSIQVMWLAPLTMIPYTFTYVGPGETVAPVVATFVGVIGAIFAGQDF